MTKDKVNSMQCKSKNKTDKTYFFDAPNNLKDKQIIHMGAVTINVEDEKLTIKFPEFIQLENHKKQR